MGVNVLLRNPKYKKKKVQIYAYLFLKMQFELNRIIRVPKAIEQEIIDLVEKIKNKHRDIQQNEELAPHRKLWQKYLKKQQGDEEKIQQGDEITAAMDKLRI